MQRHLSSLLIGGSRPEDLVLPKSLQSPVCEGGLHSELIMKKNTPEFIAPAKERGKLYPGLFSKKKYAVLSVADHVTQLVSQTNFIVQLCM